MTQMQIHSNLKIKYQYDQYKVEYQTNNGKYKVFNGIQKQLNINVTIKIFIGTFDQSLVNYLNKLKSIKSQQVIKIYQVLSNSNYLAIVTQIVSFGNLAQRLINCKKFDDQDSLYIIKYLLNGLIDILRAGIQWIGNSSDIEITQTGLKLSWNNGQPINQSQSVNCLKSVIQDFSSQKLNQNQQRLLPNPQNKQIIQLIQLTGTSASQISLNPIMKKKEKYIKKKFKNYLILKQSKQIADYFQQTISLAVSKQNGFVKIKCYNKGTLNQNILQLSKTKNTFAKVLQVIEQANKTYIVSAYSNGGTLQNYVQKLKNAGILLKQEQIQFFFYSLFEPIKLIQESSIKSLNMSLHIKNIYIQNGIPKIGQSIPLNSQIQQKLIERSDVPDFYHYGFKKNPKTYDPTYDTYSLGVLLYKLMYTEYPIFPNGKVHIPTTPTYNIRLKKTLQIFLNQGGKLSQIQKRIQVSDTVLKQIKKNKEKLLNDKKLVQQKNNVRNGINNNRQLNDQDIQKNDAEQNFNKEQVQTNHDNQEQDQFFDQCFDCFQKLQIAEQSIQPQVQSLQQSPYKIYRHYTKLICFLLIYILVLYLYYLKNNFQMLSEASNLQKVNITISTVKYQIITADLSSFYLLFNQTNKGYSDLQGIGCFIDNLTNQNGNYSDVAYQSSPLYLIYLISGLLILVLIIFMKSYLIFKFDYIKTKFNYQHGITNFNYSNYILLHLLIASLIHHHFCFFNQIFYTSLPECLGNQKSRTYSHTQFMFFTNYQFLQMHLPILLSYVLLTILHFVMVTKTDTVKYSKLFNPYFLFLPFLLAYWAVVRIGVLSDYFYPSALNDQQSLIISYFIDYDYIGILGTVPQILFIVQIIINKIIDLFYWLLIDKKRRVMIINQTSTQNIRINGSQ